MTERSVRLNKYSLLNISTTSLCLSGGDKSVVGGMDRGKVDSMDKYRGLMDNWVGNSVEVMDGLLREVNFSNIVSGGQRQLPEVSGLSGKKVVSVIYKSNSYLILSTTTHNDPYHLSSMTRLR